METVEEFQALIPALLHELGLETPAGVLQAPRVAKRKPARQNRRYETIHTALGEIAVARPKDHKEAFGSLDGRVKIPNAEPFESVGGWLAGFRKNPAAASAWLSKTWSKLGLPPFPRSPK